MNTIYALNISTHLRNEMPLKTISHFRQSFGCLFARFCITEFGYIAKNDFCFQKDYFGKPFLNTNKINIYFNISHSADWIVCALDNKKIGVDIEHIRSFEINPKMSIFFSKNEWLYITTSENKIRSFFEIWTLKESYLKYLGIGLHKPLSSFNILKKEKGYKVLDKEINTNKIEFYSFDFNQNYKIAVCSCNTEPPSILYVDFNEFNNYTMQI